MLMEKQPSAPNFKYPTREEALNEAVMKHMEESLAFVEKAYSTLHLKQLSTISGVPRFCKALMIGEELNAKTRCRPCCHAK
jgi:hypothetical protein